MQYAESTDHEESGAPLNTISENTGNGTETGSAKTLEQSQKILDDTKNTKNVDDKARSVPDVSKDPTGKTKELTDGATKQGHDTLGGAKKKTGGLLDDAAVSAKPVGDQGKSATDGITDKASGAKDQVSDAAEQGNEIPSKAADTISNLAPADIVKDPKGVFADDGVGNTKSAITNKAERGRSELKDSTNSISDQAKDKSDSVKDATGGLVDRSKEETGKVSDQAKGTTDQVQDTGKGKANTASMNGININTGDLMKAISPSGGGNMDGKGIEINVQTTKEGMSVTIKIPTFQ